MIRKLQSDDKTKLLSIIGRIHNFTDEEKEIAIELIDEALAKPEQDYYNVYIFEEEGKILGYHCIGKRALTDGVYDLYWIVVDPENQNKGVGKKLLDHAEDFAIKQKGRWILAETSSKESYTDTRNFYFRNNYTIVAQIKDFYTVKDDLIVFGKYIK